MTYKYRWFCRWCGIWYRPLKETDRDGFCCSKHKQAHWRAFRKYVTLQLISKPGYQAKSVTPSKAKKS